jgi:protocatechuate 3,4-dioxygenase beta subunit
MTDSNYAVTPSPEQVEGPYYANGGDFRSDIRDGQPGANLDLTITVIDATTGSPLPNSDVDLWQCNATGHYSGFDADPDELPADLSNGHRPTNSERFLRGRQTADENGQVFFRSIYPGWYVLRTPHIHLKVFTEGRCNVTTQLYLPEETNQDTYADSAYARSIKQDTHNRTDPVIGKFGGEDPLAWISLEQCADGFSGSATVVVDPAENRAPIFIPANRVPPPGGFEHNKPVM